MKIQGVATQMFVWGQVYGKVGKSVDENLDEIFGYISQGDMMALKAGLVGLPT